LCGVLALLPFGKGEQGRFERKTKIPIPLTPLFAKGEAYKSLQWAIGVYSMNRTFQIGRNKLTLLQNGTRLFPQLCADIDAAQRFVYLETYIFAADETGRLVSQALQRAALRHVTVRVLLDGIGSQDLPQSWVDDLRTAGVEVQWFRRETGKFNFNRFRLRRLHRKLTVIDGETAYVGGINILNDIPEGEDFDAPRLDYAVRIHGALAQQVQEEMRTLWSVIQRATLRKRIANLVHACVN